MASFQNMHGNYPEATLERFLKARDEDETKVGKMLVDCLTWRVANKIDNILATSCEAYFYVRRCKSQAKATDDDPKKKADLLKLVSLMKEEDDDMQRNNKTLTMVRESLLELDVVVARHRNDFTGDFFQHLHLLIEACQDDLDKREKLATIVSKCVIAVEAHDRVSEENRFLDAAQMKFDFILNSPSLEASATKIDHMTKTKQLDFTFILM